MKYTILFASALLLTLGQAARCSAQSPESSQGDPSPRQIASELRFLDLVFAPSIFTGDEFPECDFLDKDRAKQLIGVYSVDAQFYNAAQEEVEAPEEVGRYGAIVTVRGASGRELTRYRTLFKRPEGQDRWGPPIEASFRLPGEFGIDPKVARGQGRQVVTTLLRAAERDSHRSHEVAVLLAGLHETSAEAESATFLDDANAIDRAWWLGLTRKLNGNAERFAGVTIPRPTKITGTPAPVLREGTLAEAGMKPSARREIDAVLNEWAGDTDESFIACVARRGVVVLHRAYGDRDGEPVTTETKNFLASITKAMSGTVATMFADRGLISFSDPVEEYLPEFDVEGVDKSATIRHLFTHTADMESHDADGLVDIEHLYGGQTYQELKVGAQHRYNGDSLGVGVRVLEQISGKTLPQLYKECLFDPLGCESIEASNASWNAQATAMDLARIGQLLANRGAYGDKRFFSNASFRNMLPRSLNDLLNKEQNIEWGIGLTWFGDGVIGHGSATSCTLMVDLKNDLVITMTRGRAGRNFWKYQPRFLQAVRDNIAPAMLNPLIGDHMVVQRGKPVRVWGWTHPGKEVRVTLAGEQATAVADRSGNWRASLPALDAGGPHTLQVEGHESKTIEDILVGDVWVCSGQSNMVWPVSRSDDAEAEIAAADHPGIRLFKVANAIATAPRDAVSGEWSVCSPKSIPGFSAVGYYFGRKLHEEVDVPIGLIQTAWGGTLAEAWTDAESLKSLPEFTEAVRSMELAAEEDSGDPPVPVARVDRWYQQNRGKLGPDGRELASYDDSDWKSIRMPGFWEEAGVGLSGFDGVVWLRKEFDLPEGAAGEVHVLTLGTIDDVDTTWINGRRIGSKTVHNQPRSYKIPGDVLKPGRNVVAIRVYDSIGAGGVVGQDGDLLLHEQGDLSQGVSLAGEWRFEVAAEKSDLSPFPPPIGSSPHDVTVLFNGMLAPLTPLPIKGVTWYQGESNAGRAEQYQRLLPTMIRGWRKDFGQGDFPFLVVQLANFLRQQSEPSEGGWAELREAQALTAAADPNVGLAVTTDIGEARDIHPRNKQDVGKRLALSALRIAYDRDVVDSGPTYREMTVDGAKVRLSFDGVGGGLSADGELKGFAIAGDDGEFVWADAEIDGDQVVLSSPDTPEPKAVRYNWASNPIGNLFNEEGLPAAPFRTDGPAASRE